MSWQVSNIRSDYEYAMIEFMGDMGYKLSVKSNSSIHGSMDFYKTLQGAKSAFTKNYQSPRWGKDYPKPIWEHLKP